MNIELLRVAGAAGTVLAICAGSAAAEEPYLGGRTLQGRVTGSYVRAAAGVFIDPRIAAGLRDQPTWADIATQTDSGARLDVLAQTPPGATVLPGTRVETRIAHSPKTKMAVVQETNKIIEIVASATEPALALQQPAGALPAHVPVLR